MTAESQIDHSWLYQDPIAEVTAIKRRLILSGADLLDLSMINPDIAPSRILIDKLSEYTLKPDQHKYAVSRGIRKLREAFQIKYSKTFGVTLDEEREICALSGTKEGLYYILHSLVTASCDTVLVAAPTYPIYLSAINLIKAKPAFFNIDADESVMLTRIDEALEESGAKILLLNFPNNPTGICVSSRFWEELARITFQRGVTVINDFVYGEMGYESTIPSMLSARGINPLMVETYSLSKAYSVAGWRIGAALGAESIVRDVARLKSHSDYGSFLPLQHAASFALTCDTDLVSGIVGQYRRRMNILCDGLKGLGWQVNPSSAGPYIWAKVPSQFNFATGGDFVRRLLESSQVLFTPGALYGSDYNQWVRIALVCSEEKLHQVLSRLYEFHQSIGH
jgi:alanine-synthesizing transaminase